MLDGVVPYSVPFKLREIFEKELEFLLSIQVLEPVKFSRCAAPVVLLPKPDGGLRTFTSKEHIYNFGIYTEKNKYSEQILRI